MQGTCTDSNLQSCSWSQDSNNPTQIILSGTTITFSPQRGEYTFTLTATDYQYTRSDSITITVKGPPTAYAGDDDRVVQPGATVTLQGSGSDPDGDKLSYEWKNTGSWAGPILALSDAPEYKINKLTDNEKPTLEFTTPVLDSLPVGQHIVLEFTLSVKDDAHTVTDSVNVTVNTSPTLVVERDDPFWYLLQITTEQDLNPTAKNLAGLYTEIVQTGDNPIFKHTGSFSGEASYDLTGNDADEDLIHILISEEPHSINFLTECVPFDYGNFLVASSPTPYKEGDAVVERGEVPNKSSICLGCVPRTYTIPKSQGILIQ